MGKTPFAKSSPKTALIQRLGLYGYEGDRIYLLLYNEAIYGRDRLSGDYNSLTKYSKKHGVRAPYKWDDLSETARHKEILNIVRTASVCTRPYYQMGRWMTAEEENWVAEWFLWHSFRFRDNRNNQAAAQHSTGDQTTASSGPGQEGTSTGPFWATVLQQ
ncbi:hypothetical protein P171DRAFT_189453 [Karstenula rhodostoma CBS 690.94]|uniref:Uncharacterized protein n=1 Tax=Karstenula rhodostoma CBS 690.94 TaxID=1392251 RepID=A0A9P4UG78_9PLEO|nr:hypothetical protein P171DRAFT_189453 [Karstenula rhodostoma CBS 690.94]